MLVSIRPGYSAASCYIVTGLGPLESLYNLCLRLFAQVTREAAFCHIDGPRSIRESLHACVHSPRWRQRSAILRRAAIHSRVPAYLCSFTQGTRGQRSATLRRASIHSRISVCLYSSAQVTWEQRTDTLRRALGLLESLCIVVFILVCGFAAVLDPLWKALLQALHSREIFSCTTDNRKRKKNIPF